MAGHRGFNAAVLLLAGALLPAHANAESRFETGSPSPLATSAHLDFTIVIPGFVYFGVGVAAKGKVGYSTGSLLFAVEARSSGGPAAATPDGGAIATRVISNSGTIVLSANGPAATDTGSAAAMVSSSNGLPPRSSDGVDVEVAGSTLQPNETARFSGEELVNTPVTYSVSSP